VGRHRELIVGRHAQTMITRLRNKAFKRLGLSLSLLILTFVILSLRSAGLPEALVAVAAIISVTFSVILYVQGNIALAEAKGHHGSSVAAIIIVASLCLGGLFFAMPLILLFGFEDRNKVRKRSRAVEPESVKRKSTVELPPRKNDPAA